MAVLLLVLDAAIMVVFLAPRTVIVTAKGRRGTNCMRDGGKWCCGHNPWFASGPWLYYLLFPRGLLGARVVVVMDRAPAENNGLVVRRLPGGQREQREKPRRR